MKAFPGQRQEFSRVLELAGLPMDVRKSAHWLIREEKCKEVLRDERPRERSDGGDAAADETRREAPNSEAPPLPLLTGTGWDPLALLGNAPNRERDALPGRAALDLIAPELLRAIAWGGDRRRGTARLELGGSRYAGATLQIDAGSHVVSVEVDAPAGVDARELAERIERRLRARGLDVASLVVR